LNEYAKDKTPPVDVDWTIVTLPSRNIGFAGRFTYSYDSRYFIEGNFGYTGSEKFAKKNQFQIFPSIGLAWNITGEHFYPESWTKVMNQLKLKWTRGTVGNDDISQPWDRFYYLSDVSSGGYGYSWGSSNPVYYSGYLVNRYANDDINWKVSLKTNYGVELGLFNKLTLQCDYFTDRTSSIYMLNDYVPATMGLTASINSNIGKTYTKGIDASLDFQWVATKDFWLTSRMNYTYVHQIVTENGEPDYQYAYRSQIGKLSGQLFGLVAERLFTDEDDVRNSPPQFNNPDILPGDIKYVDINNDGIIDKNDIVAIGYPSEPQIVYGFGASVGYKGLDFSFFFQGSARSSFFIDPSKIAPFIGNRNALTIIANNHWSYDNPDPYAYWPRMAVEPVPNNETPAYYDVAKTQPVFSTWWLRDGSFLRLKTLEIGYTISDKIMKKYGINGFRFYATGTNLFNISRFKMWDVEMSGNGLDYPIQRVFNAGLQFNF